MTLWTFTVRTKVDKVFHFYIEFVYSSFEFYFTLLKDTDFLCLFTKY